ncbi:hypothetical protein PVAP13_4NG180944 [Panicum virgatum]|uniref:Meg domain-containing protein n=1 Tax=Panicum virgatum TaxID=38727 RepID=A0A8T0TF75_PANVG|nr:hypothetical protein PVAP13_4NG180944 [Panicum virgatum]
MEKHTVHNGVLVLLPLLLLGCLSIHVECRAAMDEMMGDQVCTYCDCRGQYGKADCWCCVKDKRVRARYPGRDECLLKCPIIS